MSQPQQILHVVSALDGYGLNRQLELLLEQQLAAGQSVRVVALTADRLAVAALERLGIDCRVLDRRWRRDPFVAVRLAKELRRRDFDVLHLWGPSARDYVAAVEPFVPTSPAVTSLADHTLVNAQPSSYVTPCVASPGATSQLREQFLADQLLPDEAILIAVAGPLTRAQQIDEAIWYFELVRTLDERVRLLIFGDGPERHRLERFSRLAAEPSAIRFLGYRSDFRALLPCVDLFWHTAEPDEALPLTMLEALSAGVPVVANDGPGCRELLCDVDGVIAGVVDGAVDGTVEAAANQDLEHGCLVPNKDRAAFARQTLRLIQADGRTKRAVDGAKKFDVAKTNVTNAIVERFSVEAMTAAYADLYDELLTS